MHQINIEFLAVNKISVTVPDGVNEKATGYLLNNSGVNLEEFSLLPGINNITLKTKERGNYVLRVETTKEVAVKQISIGNLVP